MVEVIIFAEGETEEKFIKQVLAPELWSHNVSLDSRQMRTSLTGKGGAVTIDRVLRNIRNTLRQRSDTILGTFFDLYALDVHFPGFQENKNNPDVYARVQNLQNALHTQVIAEVKCRPERFIPHIQPYEFEALLFSDVGVLGTVEASWGKSVDELRKIRAQCESPEHINDSYETAPSRRLEKLLHPAYKKVLHGPLAAQKITLEVIERECPHFKKWMDALRKLGHTA